MSNNIRWITIAVGLLMVATMPAALPNPISSAEVKAAIYTAARTGPELSCFMVSS